MTKRSKTVTLIAIVIVIIAWLARRAWLWDVFFENDSMQACEKPFFGYSLVYCLPNAAADREACPRNVVCAPHLWCDCAWATRPGPWYSEQP
jgi:hypothetical protein